MKTFVSALLIALTFSNFAVADCNFATDITKNDNGTYTYTKECHIAVGVMKRDLDSDDAQLAEYQKVIDLKDLALTKSNANSQLWMDTSFRLQDRMNSVDSLSSKNQLLTFGLGVVFTGLAVWAAGQLRR